VISKYFAGEWFPSDLNAIEAAGLMSHNFAFNGSTAFTVGGWPGPLYKCSTIGNSERI
jgi:hypothetical protein